MSTKTKKVAMLSSFEKKTIALLFTIILALYILLKLVIISSTVYLALIFTVFIIGSTVIIKNKVRTKKIQEQIRIRNRAGEFEYMVQTILVSRTEINPLYMILKDTYAKNIKLLDLEPSVRQLLKNIGNTENPLYNEETLEKFHKEFKDIGYSIEPDFHQYIIKKSN